MPVIPLSIKMVLQSMVQEVISSLLCFCENSQKEVEVFLLIFHSNSCLEFRVSSLVKLFSILVALKVVLNRVHRSYVCFFWTILPFQVLWFSSPYWLFRAGCSKSSLAGFALQAPASKDKILKFLPPKIRFSSFCLQR